MKQTLKSFCYAAAFAVLLAGFNSCDTGYRHHRGGNIDPEEPSRPADNGGDVPSRDITLTNGWAEFYGQFYSDNTDNYLLYLYEGKTDDDGNFTASAHELRLDIILPKGSNLTIRDGVYSCSDEKEKTFVFVPAYDNKDEDGNPVLDGSTLFVQRDPNHKETIAISDGKLEVKSYVTGQTGIEATVVAGGQEYKFHFKGKIEIDDMTEPDIPKDVEMKNITRVVAEDWGQVWDGIECTDYRDWVLYFYDKDASTTNEYTCVEILTEEKYDKSLPEQVFNKIAFLDNTADFVPGAVIAGYTDEDSYAWGTWYCKGGTAWYAATKGSLSVRKSGDGYALSFDFVDEDETYGGTFKGSYTGKVEFTSAETKAGTGKRFAGARMQPRRGASLARGSRTAAARSHRTSVKVK